VAPVGRVTVNDVAVAAETVALTAPKYTILEAATALKPLPVIVTRVPTGPVAGAKLVITGGANHVNPASVEVPPGLVTTTLPVAPLPTMAVILLLEFIVNDKTFTPPTVIAVTPVSDVPVIFNIVP
jgi:hypothetical protein